LDTIPFTGAIIYDLWQVGKTEMLISEGIHSDFHDTGYGIGRLLSWMEKHDFGDKVPPIHILPTDFVEYHSDLQGSMYHWGYMLSLVNDDKEQLRSFIKEQIECLKSMIDKPSGHWTEEDRIRHQKNLEERTKQLNDLSN